jgi:cathepsin A (carboxypeptidase C)
VNGSQYDTTDANKHYFYWFFERRSTSLQPASSESTNENEHHPLLIWLNGGPGCSSLLGLLTENGPCLVNAAGDGTVPNPNSWNKVAHVLYLDQPAKVGYSYGEANDSNENMISEDAYFFIQAFLQSEEGEKYQSSPLYLTGESYAGHYIPAIAHRILDGNQHYKENNLLNLQLAGAAIGNPWVDPEEQFKWYATMATDNSHGLKIFTDDEVESIKKSTPQCIDGIHRCNNGNSLDTLMTCQIAYAFCEELNIGPIDAHGISYYDISKPVSVHYLLSSFAAPIALLSTLIHFLIYSSSSRSVLETTTALIHPLSQPS